MRPDDLDDRRRRIVDALIDSPLAWQSAPHLARSAGICEEEAADALAELEVDGWVVAWPDPPVGPYPWPEPVVTFSPLAAECLEIRIVEVGPHETPRWARADFPEPSPPKAGRIFGGRQVLDLVVDPSPGPEELAIAAEETPSVRRRMPEVPGVWPDARREKLRADRARSRRKARKRSLPCPA